MLLPLFFVVVLFFLVCAIKEVLSLAYVVRYISEYHVQDNGQHAHHPAVIGKASELTLVAYVFQQIYGCYA